MLTAALFSFFFFLIGKVIGSRAPSILQTLKHKYENIEIQKKKMAKTHQRYEKLIKFLKYFNYFLILSQLILIANIVYMG